MLNTQQLCIARGGRTLCRDLDLSIESGQSWLILGENGSGKSTLLATLAAWLPAQSGEIQLNKQSISAIPARQRARQLAWQSQIDDNPFPMTVLEKVLTARHPYLGRWQWESAADIALAQQQLARLDLADLAQRDLATLSGGERRRVALATALTQGADLMLLDEPLSQLDLRHQQQALSVLREENQAGRTLIVVGHDPNHAARFASHALLMFGDGRWLAGTCADILNSDNLSALYHYPVRACDSEHGSYFVPG